MIIFEIGGRDYEMPEGWDEVNLDMFRKIQKHSSILNKYKSTVQFTLEMTAILLKAPIEILTKLDRGSYITISEKCDWIQADLKPNKKKKTYEINGETYVPVENLNKLSMGDSVSLELMIAESDEVDVLPNILPILIRKGVKKMKNGKEVLVPGEFDAENYEETKQLFLDNLMITDVIHLQSFFLNGAEASSITMNPISESRKERRKKTVKK